MAWLNNSLSEDEKYKSGIYIIKSLIDSRVYIGSCLLFGKRCREHANDILNNEHDNGRLQNFGLKYGIDKLRFEILEVVEDKAILIPREQYWIDYYDASNRDKGFNICPKAGSTLGLPVSEERKEILRQKMTGAGNHNYRRKFNKEHLENMSNSQSIKIGQFSLDGCLIKEWKNAKIAALESGFCEKEIRNNCKERIKSYKGFVWKYLSLTRAGKPIDPLKQEKFGKKIGLKNAIPLKQYSPDGKLIKTWESLKLASRELKIPHSTLKHWVNKDGLCRGFLWKRDMESEQVKIKMLAINNNKRSNSDFIGQFDLTFDLIKVWDYASDAAELDFKTASVHEAIRSKKPYKNFYWRRLPKDIRDYQTILISPILL